MKTATSIESTKKVLVKIKVDVIRDGHVVMKDKCPQRNRDLIN